MIKINKTTHIMILSVFAIVFIVVYLYYTVNDVKKLSIEVKKNSADITKLTQDIQNAMNVLTNLNNDVLEVKGKSIGTSNASVALVVDKDEEEANSEESSVDSQMFKKIITGDDDDDDDGEDVVEDEPLEEEAEEVPTPVDYKSMKYDELKDEAKRRGLSAKGSKDQLIARLESA